MIAICVATKSKMWAQPSLNANTDDVENKSSPKKTNNNKHVTMVEIPYNDLPTPLNMLPLTSDFISWRDRAVLNDKLYPPLNRSPLQKHDNYRLIGYLVGDESANDSWQLYGRQVYNNRGQFYVIPTDRNSDIKIALDEDIMYGTRLRDVDNLPSSIQLDHPMFTSKTYNVIENKRADFNSFYY